MNSSFKRLTFVVPALGLLATSLSFPLPARASLPCSNGTISSYQNGSIASCVIDANVEINTGNFALSCQQGHSISFDDKARLQSCILSTPLSVRKGSAVEICLAKSRVDVSFLKDGSQNLSCQNL